MINDKLLVASGGGGSDSTILTIVMEAVPSDIAIHVYFLDGTKHSDFPQGTTKEFSIKDVSYIDAITPRFGAIGLAIETDNLLQESIDATSYRYTIDDRSNNAWLRTYYSDEFVYYR